MARRTPSASSAIRDGSKVTETGAQVVRGPPGALSGNGVVE
jgi:hypothetical protein